MSRGHLAHCGRWPLIALTGCVLAGSLALAQSQPFCVLQNVNVSRVSNAVTISLEADGLIDVRSQGLETWQQDERGGWYPQALERLTFTLSNVRAGAAPMVQIADYPVSHLEFALLPGERDNIGLRCTLVLYVPAIVTVFSGTDDSWDFGAWRPPGPRVMIQASQKRDKILITVVSDRPEEPEPTRPELPEIEPKLSVSGTAEALNLAVLKSDLHDVIRQVAECTGAAICVDDPVANRVTAHFENMPLRRVLSALATAYGLCLSEIDGMYHFSLSPPDTATTYRVAETRTVALNYLPVQSALMLLPDVALPYVRRADAGNRLVLSGPPALVERLARNIAALDQPAYHCRLQGWVIASEADDTAVKDVLAQFSGGTTSEGVDSSGNLTLAVGAGRSQKVLVRLRALTGGGRLKLQRLPSIWCQNGQTASLFIGDTVYYWRFPRRSSDPILDNIQAGTRVVFQPRTDGDYITAGVSVLSDYPAATAQVGSLGPLIMRRSAATTIRMQSGQLMIIGGLRQVDSTRLRQNPAPLLWPVDAVAAGHLRLQHYGEVTVLVQMDAALTPPVDENSLSDMSKGPA